LWNTTKKGEKKRIKKGVPKRSFLKGFLREINNFKGEGHLGSPGIIKAKIKLKGL